MTETSEGGSPEKSERIPIPQEDPSVLEGAKRDLLQRLDAVRAAHKDIMSDAYYDVTVSGIRDSSDRFALKLFEDAISAREYELEAAGLMKRKAETEADPAESKAAEAAEQAQAPAEEAGEKGSEVVRYQSRDEGIAILKPDGSVDRIVAPGSDEEREIAHQMTGNAPSGKVRYQLEMLSGSDVEGDKSKDAKQGVKADAPAAQKQKAPEQAPAEPKANADLDDLKQRLLARNQIKREKAEGAHEKYRTRRTQEQQAEETAAAQEAVQGSPKEQRDKFARELLKTARRADFSIAEANADNWRGGPGQGEQNMYRHPGMPGYLFAQEQVDWVEKREAEEREAAHGDGAHRGGPKRKASDIIPEAHDRRRRDASEWNVRIKAFKGIEPKTLRQILASERDQKYFGMLVNSLDDRGTEIMRKSQQQELLTPEEMMILNYARYEYTRRTNKIEDLQRHMNIDNLTLAARHDEALEAAIGLNGPQRTLEILRVQMLHLGMMNIEDFNRSYDTWHHLLDLRENKKYKRWEKDIKKFCEKEDLTIDEFNEKYGATMTKDQRAELRKQISRELYAGRGVIGRVFDNMTFRGMSRYDAKRLVKKASSLNARMNAAPVADVDNSLRDLAIALRYTVVDNPVVAIQLQQEAVQNKNLRPAGEEGPGSFADARAKEEPARQEIETDLNQHVASYRTDDGRAWDYMTSKERRASLTDFNNKYEDRGAHAGEGWFASALRAVWRAFMNKKRDELINKPTKH